MTALPGVLAVDVGNTSTKVASAEEGRVAPLLNLPTPRGGAALAAGDLPPWPAVVCCVVDEALPAVERALAERTGHKVRVVGRDLPFPLPLDYRTPETLGPDRVLCAFAAWHEFRRAVVVVDAGSALTVDLVDEEGTFRGGAIAPGFSSLGRALKDAAPALELVEPTPEAAWPGASSLESCRTGVTAAARGTIRELMRAGVRRLGGPGPVVVTGGDGPLLVRLVPEIGWELRPDLLLRGLALTAWRHG